MTATPKVTNINKRQRDVGFFMRANRNKVMAVDPKTFHVSWNIDAPTFPRILGVPADFGGCGSYRIIQPLMSLIRNKHTQGYVSNKKFNSYEIARLKPDTVIFQRQVTEPSLQYVKQITHINQCFTVMEYDDLLDAIDDKNVSKNDFSEKEKNNLYAGLRTVDRLVCSTPFIAQEYGKYSTDVKIAPNYLEKSKWMPLIPKRNISKKPRVGWAGGFSHVGDLEVLIDVIKELHKEVDFVFMGLCLPEIEPYIAEYVVPTDYRNYHLKLSTLNLDLAIIPLAYTKFNLGKSNLKVLEMGVLGYPIIATDISTYHGFPITYIKNNDKDLWIKSIRDHINNLDETYRKGDELRNFIHNNYMLEDNLNVWLDAWTPS